MAPLRSSARTSAATSFGWSGRQSTSGAIATSAVPRHDRWMSCRKRGPRSSSTGLSTTCASRAGTDPPSRKSGPGAAHGVVHRGASMSTQCRIIFGARAAERWDRNPWRARLRLTPARIAATQSRLETYRGNNVHCHSFLGLTGTRTRSRANAANTPQVSSCLICPASFLTSADPARSGRCGPAA